MSLKQYFAACFLAAFVLIASIPGASATFQVLSMKPSVVVTDTAYVTGQTLSGTVRNDGGGYYTGFKFTVLGTAITVTSVGRWKYAGDSHTHTMQFFSYSGDTPTPSGASVDVDMSQAADADGYVYATLATPQFLIAFGVYAIGSQETDGVDHFYQNDTTITTTAVAVANNGFYYLNGSSFGTTLGAGTTYGPVNFKYH